MPQGSANGRDFCHCRVDWTKRLDSKPARAAERSRVRIVAGAFHCRFALCFTLQFVYTGSVKSVSRPHQYWLRYWCFALRLEAQRLERGLCRSFEAALWSSGVAFSNLNTNTATLNQQTLRDRRTSRFQWNISHRSLTLQCLDILNILDDGSISRMRLVVKSRYNGLSPGHSSIVQHAPTSHFF